MASSLSGYLLKRGKSRKAWKRRWFLLRSDLQDPQLNYFKHSESTTVIGTIHLNECQDVTGAQDVLGQPTSFKLVLPKRTYFMLADTVNERDMWVKMLSKYIRASCDPPRKLLESYLFKQGGGRKSNAWRRRWCVLTAQRLCYYTNNQCTEMKGVIDLNAILNITLPDPSLCPKKLKFSFDLVTCGRTYAFLAKSNSDKIDWIKAITSTLEEINGEALAISMDFDSNESNFSDKCKDGKLVDECSSDNVATTRIHIDSCGDGNSSDDDFTSKPEPENMTTSHTIRSGWLTKQGGGYKNWKRRYFILTATEIIYFTSTDQSEQKGKIDLNIINGVAASPPSGGKDVRFYIATSGRTYHFITDRLLDRDKWVIDILEAVTQYNNAKMKGVSDDIATLPVSSPKPLTTLTSNPIHGHSNSRRKKNRSTAQENALESLDHHICVESCVAYGPALVKGYTGTESMFTIVCVDASGAPLSAPIVGDARMPEFFSIKVNGPFGLTPPKPYISYHGEGTYTVTFTTEAEGDYVVAVTRGNRHVSNSPFYSPHYELPDLATEESDEESLDADDENSDDGSDVFVDAQASLHFELAKAPLFTSNTSSTPLTPFHRSLRKSLGVDLEVDMLLRKALTSSASLVETMAISPSPFSSKPPSAPPNNNSLVTPLEVEERNGNSFLDFMSSPNL